MNKIIYSCLFIVITFSAVVVHSETCWGGELPSIRDTKVNAEVSSNGAIYTYSYTISSAPANSGSIWSFGIDIKKPREGMELSDDGIANGPRYMINTSDQVLSEPNTPKMIPVGLWSPANWISSLDVFGHATWGGSLLQPGESLNGFQIMSSELPGLRDFIIEPRLIHQSIEPDMSPEEGLAMIQEVEDSVAFKGKTIGPIAPPKIFNPINFIERINNYVNKSVTLDWLIDPALIISLQADIDAIRSFIEANDPSSAKTALSHFMTLLDEASSSQRTAEAYGLLFYNAKYLFDKLHDTYIPPPQLSNTDNLVVGLFRSDGVIVPFARYQNKKWVNSWPNQDGFIKKGEGSVGDLNEPWFENFIDIKNNWYFWGLNSDFKILNSKKLLQVMSHCEEVWGLQTDFVPMTNKIYAERQTGLALNIKQNVRSFVKQVDSTETNQIHSSIYPIFTEAENKARSGVTSRGQIPTSKVEREKVEMRFNKLYRAEIDNGDYLYYFEAVKEYKKSSGSNEYSCNDISFLKGWLRGKPNGKHKLLDYSFSFTDCDWQRVDTNKPYGILRIDERLFIILGKFSYESENYLILELEDLRLKKILETYGGSC